MVHLDRLCSVLSLEVSAPCSRGVCLGQRARAPLEGRVRTCGMTQRGLSSTFVRQGDTQAFHDSLS